MKQGAIVNSHVYIDDILAPVLRDIKEYFKNEDFTIQQVGAFSHASNKIQTWWKANFLQFWSKKL